MRLPIILSFLLFSLALSACGGGGTSSGELPRSTCRVDTFEGDVGLPASFPRPAEFIVTNSKQQGPTRVVDGYWDSELDDAYRGFVDAVEEAGYAVTFDEIEEHDAEVAYKGSGRSGLIALRDRCTEDAVTLVRITNRPE